MLEGVRVVGISSDGVSVATTDEAIKVLPIYVRPDGALAVDPDDLDEIGEALTQPDTK